METWKVKSDPSVPLASHAVGCCSFSHPPQGGSHLLPPPQTLPRPRDHRVRPPLLPGLLTCCGEGASPTSLAPFPWCHQSPRLKASSPVGTRHCGGHCQAADGAGRGRVLAPQGPSEAPGGHKAVGKHQEAHTLQGLPSQLSRVRVPIHMGQHTFGGKGWTRGSKLETGRDRGGKGGKEEEEWRGKERDSRRQCPVLVEWNTFQHKPPESCPSCSQSHH